MSKGNATSMWKWRPSHMEMIFALVLPAVVTAIVVFGLGWVVGWLRRKRRRRPERRAFEVVQPSDVTSQKHR